MKNFFKAVFTTIIVILISAMLVTVGILWYSNCTVGVTGYEVKIEGLPEEFEGFKIVQLSDLHSSDIDNLYEKIDKQSPDIVVMSGDMISTDDENFDVFLKVAEKIAGKYVTYFVFGNHEQALPVEKCMDLTSKLENAGVIVLDNSMEKLSIGEASINLYGLWYNLRFYRDVNDKSTEEYVITKEYITDLLGKPPKGVNILLTHNPVYFDAYADWGANLVLSGHMHGGMINVPFKGGLFSPEKEYYPEYDAGSYKKQRSTMIVSRGLGQHKGFRFLNQPEIVVITLKK